MRQDEASQDGDHKGVSGTVFNKQVDEGLEAATKGELCSKDFVLAKNDKKRAHSNPQPSKSLGVPVKFVIHGVKYLMNKLHSQNLGTSWS
jgi:hypothetical protein